MLHNTLPKRLETAQIEKEPTGPWNPAVHETVAEFLSSRKYLDEGIAPLVTGTSGTGKSYALAAATNRIRNKFIEEWGEEFEFVWAPVGETLDRVMAYRDFRSDNFWKWDNLLKRADFVIFDDFSHLRDYPRLREQFWVYLNARYDAKLPTAFTANLDLSEGWGALDEAFGEHFRRRIQSMSEGLAVSL